MTDTVTRLAEADVGRWEAYVDAHPQASFFHRAGWRTVIERSFGHTTYSLIAERDGAVRGVLPLAFYRSRLFGRALIANACCMGGAPLADDEAAYQALDTAALALMDDLGADYLEYRRPLHRHADWKAKDSLYATFEGGIAADEDANLKQIPRKQRAVVRKAIEAGLADDIDPGIDRFYPLYAESVRNLGTPVFGRRYFRTLIEVFGPACTILTVSHQGRPVSSVLSFTFRDRVMPYYVGASPEARALGSTDFLYWRLMRRAAGQGIRVFDFGRSKVGTGPYAFKKNWGFTPEPVVHEYRTRDGAPVPDVNPLNPKYRAFIALWKRLPLPVANLLGPAIVRNIG
jgi:FemAB-related protein (PEP-CTERM system-associated)